MTRVIAPVRKLTPEEQSALNDLQFRWDRMYDIGSDGHLWWAVSQGSGEILRADTAALLREQVIGHYAGLGAERIR